MSAELPWWILVLIGSFGLLMLGAIAMMAYDDFTHGGTRMRNIQDEIAEAVLEYLSNTACTYRLDRVNRETGVDDYIDCNKLAAFILEKVPGIA